MTAHYEVPSLKGESFTKEDLDLIKVNYYFWPAKAIIALSKMFIFYFIMTIYMIAASPLVLVEIILEKMSPEFTWRYQETYLNPKTILRRRIITKTARLKATPAK